MAHRAGIYARQTTRVVCLFCFLGTAGLAAGDRMLSDYAQRLTWSSPFDDIAPLTVASECARLTEASVSGGYDLIYRESATDSGTVMSDTRVGAFDGRLLITTAGRKWGLKGGWDFSRLTADWSEKGARFTYASQRSLDRFLLGGSAKTGNLSFGAVVGIDPGYCRSAKRTTTAISEAASRAWGSPGIDLSAGVSLDLPVLTVSGYYINTSPCAGSATITSSTASAHRTLPFAVDENRLGITLNYTNRGADCSLNGEFRLTGGRADAGTASGDLPLSLDGYGSKISADVASKELAYGPVLVLWREVWSIDAAGFDGTGDRFFRLDNTTVRSVGLQLKVHPGRKTVTGPVISVVRVNAGDGSMALYPFTNWLYVLDLPDRYRIYGGDFSLIEGGLSALRNWQPAVRHSVKSDIVLTGSRLNGTIETAEQVRYMGLIPVYENHGTTTFVDQKYVVIKASIRYVYTLKSGDMFLSFQQIVPVEIPEKSGAPAESRPGAIERRIYGGMRCDGGVTFRF